MHKSNVPNDDMSAIGGVLVVALIAVVIGATLALVFGWGS